MGFYYGPSGPEPDEEKPGGLKEALYITWAVFRALALPLAVLLGGVAYLVLVFFLFTFSVWAGLAAILVVVAAVVARGVWEATHPPHLE
ncbi:MAG: hypothetical protein IT304_08240 [Dehalococcoidia bacterium]|nr:hypothetical protein [Dehalococcoidia bacterium]